MNFNRLVELCRYVVGLFGVFILMPVFIGALAMIVVGTSYDGAIARGEEVNHLTVGILAIFLVVATILFTNAHRRPTARSYKWLHPNCVYRIERRFDSPTGKEETILLVWAASSWWKWSDDQELALIRFDEVLDQQYTTGAEISITETEDGEDPMIYLARAAPGAAGTS